MQSSPKVSVILPNLNNYSYIEERIQTISVQTFSNWECIVIDGFSSDGSWELLQVQTEKDQRFSLFQYPPKGPYDAWNKGIEKATGDYIYIATGDDTMTKDCLAMMVNALEDYPECDIAHCNLSVIDENGEPSSFFNWNDVPIYFSGLIEIKEKNIRYAPYDGLIHCAEGGVYTSITQLLIRSDLFKRIGMFLTNYGAIADFEWTMRAALLVNTIHIPHYLATWRIHPAQATSFQSLNTLEHQRRICELIDCAFSTAQNINPKPLKGININRFRFAKQKRVFDEEWHQAKGKANKLKLLMKWFRRNPYLIRVLIEHKLSYTYKKFDPISYIKGQIDFYKLTTCVKILNK